MKQLCATIVAAALMPCMQMCFAADPVVSNVRASQRTGTKLVDIWYNVADADGDDLDVSVTIKNGSTAVSASHVSGDVGQNLTAGQNKHIVWNAGADWNGKTATLTYTVSADDGTLTVPVGMVLIPAGSFSMGDNLDGDSLAQPVHSVYLSAVFMDKTEVTKAKWDEVANWASLNGYDISAASAVGKASSHPCQTVTWYSCVKWCNARSQKEGLAPCYTVSGATYKSGDNSPVCNWTANGYRLPTEAEWEKAARGGLSGQRFPWGDTISHSRANYFSMAEISYDTSPTREYHPTYNNGVMPFTSPCGAFTANGYGLYDMAGNVWEWCWDWYDSGFYGNSSGSDPHGPSSGSVRAMRGGDWYYFAYYCRVAYRYGVSPSFCGNSVGFRSARRAQ